MDLHNRKAIDKTRKVISPLKNMEEHEVKFFAGNANNRI